MNWRTRKYVSGEYCYLAEGIGIGYAPHLVDQGKWTISVFGTSIGSVDSAEKAKEKAIAIAKSRIKRAYRELDLGEQNENV